MKKNKIFNNTFLLFLTIITFLIGIFYFNSSEGYSLFIRLIILLISFLPFLISLLAIIVFYKKQQRFNDIFNNPFIVKIGLISCVFFYYLIAAVPCILIEVTYPATDVKSYKKIVYYDLLEYFPKDIPQNAINARFIFSPAFLQKGEYLHLYYVDETMTKELFIREYQKKAITTIKENPANKGISGYMSSPFLENRDDLDDFIVYIMKNESEKQSYPYAPEFILVAFNEKTKELFYKYEQG